MKAAVVLNSKVVTYSVLLLVGATAVYLVARKLGQSAGDLAAKVGNAVNPVSDQNLAYRGVNAVGSAVTGTKDFSLGSYLYDIFHPNDGQQLVTASDPDSRNVARLNTEAIAK